MQTLPRELLNTISYYLEPISLAVCTSLYMLYDDNWYKTYLRNKYPIVSLPDTHNNKEMYIRSRLSGKILVYISGPSWSDDLITTGACCELFLQGITAHPISWANFLVLTFTGDLYLCDTSTTNASLVARNVSHLHLDLYSIQNRLYRYPNTLLLTTLTDIKFISLVCYPIVTDSMYSYSLEGMTYSTFITKVLGTANHSLTLYNDRVVNISTARIKCLAANVTDIYNYGYLQDSVLYLLSNDTFKRYYPQGTVKAVELLSDNTFYVLESELLYKYNPIDRTNILMHENVLSLFYSYPILSLTVRDSVC